MNTKNCFRISVIILIGLLSIGQSTGQSKLRKQADQLFLTDNFSQALKLYSQYNKTSKRPKTLIRKGICEYQVGNSKDCINTMNSVLNLEKSMDEPYYYLGLSYIDLGKYEVGASYLKSYLNKSPKINQTREQQVINRLKQCEYGTRLKYANQYAYIENMGDIVNTPYNELSPVQSPNFQNKYYFSSDRDISSGGKRDINGLQNEFTGKYFYDMFAVELMNGNWTSVYPFNSLQNTARNENIQDFSKAGDAMYYIRKSAREKAELLVDTFNLTPNERIFPSKFAVPIHVEIGDKDISVFKDNIILFSSKRDGGFGGYDLYVTQKVDDNWITPVNLGPNINTAFDEESGCITKGGNFLYFSSNRPNSLGGFDIFRSEYYDNKWEEPINLGTPINSPRDEKDIFISFDGTQAVFSSNRPSGFGGFDLYLVYWKDQIIDQLNYTEALPFIQVADSISSDPILNVTAIFNTEPTVKEKIEYINTPLYYDPNSGLLSPKNIVALKSLSDFNKVYPGSKLQLLTHTGSENLKEFNLFIGIKRAEKIKEYLITKGFKSDDIELISLGNSYPLLSDQNSLIASKYHNRIDILFSNYNKEYVTIINDYPQVNNDIKSQKFDTYLSSLLLLNYRIKIAETSQMLRGDILNMDFPFIVIKEGDKLNYYLGNSNNYNYIKSIKNLISTNNLSTTLEITPFIGYNKINDITPLLKEYPDLNMYQKFGQ